MCVCGDPILMHAIPAGEDKASHCLDKDCNCGEYKEP